MRQTAWLNSMPKPLRHSRREHIQKNTGHDRAMEYEVDPGPLDWLLELLHEAGSVRQEATMNGMEYLPLSWRELYYWSQCTGQDLNPFWMRELMKLSGILAKQITDSFQIECQAPFDPG